MTIDSGDEGSVEDPPPSPAKKVTKGHEVDETLNPDFTFDLSGDPYMDILGTENSARDIVKTGSRPVRAFTTVVARVKLSVLGPDFGR